MTSKMRSGSGRLSLICIVIWTTVVVVLLPSSTQILSGVQAQDEGKLALPIAKDCRDRILNGEFNGTRYFFSWKYEPTKDMKVTWFQARNVCRRHCMDLVSLETSEENEYVKDQLIKSAIRYTWTSGRKCNFDGCDRADLQPTIINGWFWSGSGIRLGPTNNTLDGDWGTKGGDGKNQPDNRELRVTNKNDEACLAILNNFYNDGVVWHDIACYHKKYFVCEDNPKLLKFIADNNPGIKLF